MKKRRHIFKKIVRQTHGFTIIEIAVCIVLLGIIAGFVYFGSSKKAKLNAQYTRAYSEMSNIANALELYKIKYDAYPDDVDRNIPPGIQEFLSDETGNKDWPNAPWPESNYDYDNWPANEFGGPTVQISVHFCELFQDAQCAKNYPEYSWLDTSNWDSYSSMYYCIKGDCRAHRNQPKDHPGYCINCPKQ